MKRKLFPARHNVMSEKDAVRCDQATSTCDSHEQMQAKTSSLGSLFKCGETFLTHSQTLILLVDHNKNDNNNLQESFGSQAMFDLSSG